MKPIKLQEFHKESIAAILNENVNSPKKRKRLLRKLNGGDILIGHNEKYTAIVTGNKIGIASLCRYAPRADKYDLEKGIVIALSNL